MPEKEGCGVYSYEYICIAHCKLKVLLVLVFALWRLDVSLHTYEFAAAYTNSSLPVTVLTAGSSSSSSSRIIHSKTEQITAVVTARDLSDYTERVTGALA